MHGVFTGFWGKGYGGRGQVPGSYRAINNEEAPGASLESVPPGSRVKVKYIMGGWNAANRLASMGIVPGAEIEVLKNDTGYPWTPLIVRVNGVEIALGRGIASRVIVEPLE